MTQKVFFKQMFNNIFGDFIPLESNPKSLVKIKKPIDKHSSNNTLDQYNKIKDLDEDTGNHDKKDYKDEHKTVIINNKQQSSLLHTFSFPAISSSAKSLSNLSPMTSQLLPPTATKSLSSSSLSSSSSSSSISLPFSISEWNKFFSLNSSESINKERLLISLKLGIPSEIRGKIWMFISNSFNISHSFSKNFYENLLKESSPSAESIINKDVPRTLLYKTNNSMISMTNQSKKLYNVLKAYAVFDKEISYCQGMNTIAATLLQMIGNEAYCFYTFTTIMYQHNWREFYKNNTPKLFRILNILKIRLRDQLPELYQYFIDINFDQYLEIIFTHFFLTLFTYNCPLEFSYRVIDLFWVYEEKALFNAIIKVMKLKESKLKIMQFEELITYLKDDIVFEAVVENDINSIIADADY